MPLSYHVLLFEVAQITVKKTHFMKHIQTHKKELAGAIFFLLLGCVCAWAYTTTMPDLHHTKTSSELIRDLIRVGPFSLGILLGAKVLSRDCEPLLEDKAYERLFLVITSITMGLAMVGFGFFISVHEYFVFDKTKGRESDLTVLVLSMIFIPACLILNRISPRIFSSLPNLLFSVCCFMGISYLFKEVEIPGFNFEGVICMLALLASYYHLKPVPVLPRWIYQGLVMISVYLYMYFVM